MFWPAYPLIWACSRPGSSPAFFRSPYLQIFSTERAWSGTQQVHSAFFCFKCFCWFFATSDIRKSGVRNFMVCYGHNSISHGHGCVDFRQRWGASQFKIRQITEVMFILWAERCHAPKPHSIQLYIESCGKASQVMPGLE